jgi:outer membrane protein assembly factor BamB
MCYGDGKVYAVGSTLLLYCHDAKTGEPIWEKRLNNNVADKLQKALQNNQFVDWFVGGSRMHHCAAMYLDGLVIMYNYRGSLVALNGDDGSEVWKVSDLYENTPGVWRHGEKNYLLTFTKDRGNVVCLEAKTGTEVWRCARPGDIRPHGPTAYGDRMYISVGVLSKGAEVGIYGVRMRWTPFLGQRNGLVKVGDREVEGLLCLT